MAIALVGIACGAALAAWPEWPASGQTPPSASGDAGRVMDAARTDGAGAADARSPFPDGAPFVDSPPWPAGFKKMRLTWVVYPVVVRGNGLPTRQIELVVRAGEVARRLRTEVRGSVSYATAMQPDCARAPGEPIRSAQLFMNGGGNTELLAARHGDELWLAEDDSSDGLCEPSPCPSNVTLLGHMTVPADVTFEERFHVIESASAEHDEACEPR